MKTRIILISSLLLGAIFTACEKSDIPDRTFVADGAKVCFINLAGDIVTTNTCEMNLYFNDQRVTTQGSTATNKLRGIPFRSSYPGAVVPSPGTTTYPSSYIGAEYFNATPGQTTIVGKDTAWFAGFTTLFTTNYTFEKDKYYSIYAMGLRSAISPVIVEDQIVQFSTTGKTKVRVVNALYGVSTDSVDIWMIYQPISTEQARAPFKLASYLDSKSTTAYVDTLKSGNYKWAAVVAGTTLTITPPANPLGNPYTITVPAGKTVIALSSSTAFSQKTTYSLLFYGQVGKTGFLTPVASLFRQRLN
ncbi:MAG: hypothetical protein U0X39_10585 [Bacteroidales bacterium]